MNASNLRSLIVAVGLGFASTGANVIAEDAPAGFDGKSNGVASTEEFFQGKLNFETSHTRSAGLGPVYNALSCVDCHQNPTTGGNSEVNVLRAGTFDGHRFRAPPDGSLIHERAVDARIQPRAADSWNVRSLRLSMSTLGDGFVEAIEDDTLREIAARQIHESGGEVKGHTVMAPVLEAPGTKRIGRFGWKDQHASLLSFNAEAYRDEIGVTSELAPTESTSNGRSVAAYDPLPDPENRRFFVESLTVFNRSTKVPPRDLELANTAEALAGEKLFASIGCGICHVATIETAPTGTPINGGTFIVPAALGGKTIHPYGDYLLHDIGTGDGIVQTGGQETRNKIRTAPLWGLRTRIRLLHDGSVLTPREAIARHGGESGRVTTRFDGLSAAQQRQLIAFLRSL
ncbi:MAG: di-heme oxidoredictase family protein [Methylotetracoccus sp.]